MFRKSALALIGAVVILLAAPTWAGGDDQIKLLASDGGVWRDNFGYSVALDGDVAVVGMMRLGEDESAYVFRFDGENWIEEAKLTPPEGVMEEYFGYSVALDGEVAMVAAGGAVYMFRYQDPNWVREAKLTVPGLGLSAVLMSSGNLLAVEGNVVVVGASLDYDAGYLAGAVHVFRYNGNSWQEEAKLFADDAQANQLFGDSVALEGDRILIGASGFRSGSPGAAYVFQYQDPNWIQQAKLTASDEHNTDFFGKSVALNNQTAVIAAPYAYVSDTKRGAAYVFQYHNGDWIQEAKLTVDGANFDIFASVALEDHTVLVGVNRTHTFGCPHHPQYRYSGSVHVFRYDGSDWHENGLIRPRDGYYYDKFGSSMALNNGRALVGAPHDNQNGEHAGAAYIFDTSCIHHLSGDFNNDCRINLLDYARLGAQWLIDCRRQSLNPDCFLKSIDFEDDKLQPPDLLFSEAKFGCSVSIFNDNAIIGAYDDEYNAGSAFIYSYNNTSWAQENKLTALDASSTMDRFAVSVALSDDIALVGAPGKHQIFHPDYMWIGAAYIFRYHDPNWVQEIKLTASDAAPHSYFGDSVALEGNTAMVGAFGVDDFTGAVYVFEYLIPPGAEEPNWIQTAKLTASDGATGDYFGTSIALDGDTLIIGALYDDDVGDYSGSAYIFRYNGNNWIEQAKLTAADAAAQDKFGCSVAIDGNLAVVSANGDDDEGSGAGSAYIFQYQDPNWIQIAKLNPWDGKSGDTFGAPVAINGDLVLVGAYNKSDDANPYSVYVFKYDGADWTGVTKLKASDGADKDYFGAALALQQNTAFIGAPGDDGDTGSAYVFDLSCPYTLLSDINSDSRVDMLDLALWTSGWLINCNANPTHPRCVPKYK